MNRWDRQTALKQPDRGRLFADHEKGGSKGEDAAFETQGRFAVIGQLETGVSKLQVASRGIQQIRGHLWEIRDFLDEISGPIGPKGAPASVVNNYLKDRLIRIKRIIDQTAFEGRRLLNGDQGVRGKAQGKGLFFVKGSASSQSSTGVGYPVSITKEARPAAMIGAERLTKEAIEQETLIAVADEHRELKYKVGNRENPRTLVNNLQHSLWEQGIDVSVYLTADNRLFLMHNQMGSQSVFHGMSYKSRLISAFPGTYRKAAVGRDIEGSIGTELAEGYGGFLTGSSGNRRTEGLSIYYSGQLDYPGQVVGYVQVTQQGILMPMDRGKEKMERLSIPPLNPEQMAIGVSNHSGFVCLDEIRAGNLKERRDAMKLVLWTISELERLCRDMKGKEDSYVQLAIDMLRNVMSPKDAGEEILHLSKDKAGEMAEQLKTMITPGNIHLITGS